MVPRENKSNAYSTFGWTNKDYYCFFSPRPLDGCHSQWTCSDHPIIKGGSTLPVIFNTSTRKGEAVLAVKHYISTDLTN